MSTRNTEQAARVTGPGFIAALDQSGGSTPKALAAYGIEASAYRDEEEMFDLVHAMRERIMTAEPFDGTRIMGTILFEQTMRRTVDGVLSGVYLWDRLGIVPFLKVDKGLVDAADGVRLMKPIPQVDHVVEEAAAHGIFGTKMRSVIDGANATGIARVLDQQFDFAEDILAGGLVPIIEPEVTITIEDKKAAEEMLVAGILERLPYLGKDERVMLKLSLPETDGLYSDLVAHPKVLKVVALSGGYARAEACARLSRQDGVVASFSRALTEGLSAGQSDAEFSSTLETAIAEIFAASAAPGA